MLVPRTCWCTTLSQWYMSTKAGGSGRARRAWFVVGFGFVFEAGRGEVGRGEVGLGVRRPGLGSGRAVRRARRKPQTSGTGPFAMAAMSCSGGGW